MADGFDASQLRQLARDLGEIAPAMQKNSRKAATVTAFKVKAAWNQKLYADGHAKLTRGAISYELDPSDSYFPVPADSISVEIGAVTGSGRQAGIVRLLENGSAHNGAHGYGAAALHENEADFEHGISLAAADAEKQAGL